MKRKICCKCLNLSLQQINKSTKIAITNCLLRMECDCKMKCKNKIGKKGTKGWINFIKLVQKKDRRRKTDRKIDRKNDTQKTMAENFL